MMFCDVNVWYAHALAHTKNIIRDKPFSSYLYKHVMSWETWIRMKITCLFNSLPQ